MEVVHEEIVRQQRFVEPVTVTYVRKARWVVVTHNSALVMWAIENAVSQLPVRCRVVGSDFKLQPTDKVPVTLQRNCRVFNFLESSYPAPEGSDPRPVGAEKGGVVW